MRKIALLLAGLLALSFMVLSQASAAPMHRCNVGAWANRPTSSQVSYTAHFPRTCGGQARAAAYVNGYWVHGPWRSTGPSHSTAYCKGSCPPLVWRAWGWDWRTGPGGASHYHQLGHN